jgi:hypothetical protein
LFLNSNVEGWVYYSKKGGLYAKYWGSLEMPLVYNFIALSGAKIHSLGSWSGSSDREPA